MKAAEILALFDSVTGQTSTAEDTKPFKAWPGFGVFWLKADLTQQVQAEDFMNNQAVSVASEVVAAGHGCMDGSGSAVAVQRLWKVSLKSGALLYFVFHETPALVGKETVYRIGGQVCFVPSTDVVFAKAFETYLRNMVVHSGFEGCDTVLQAVSAQLKGLLEKIPADQQAHFIAKFQKAFAEVLPVQSEPSL